VSDVRTRSARGQSEARSSAVAKAMERPRRSSESGGGRRASHNVTALLIEWRGGDEGAAQKLLPLVDDELRRIAIRFFGGLSVEETAEVLQISEETVMRDWKFAKNWLMRELSWTRTGEPR
jgi:DNA-directed RNA polymerase specialized sigma subunit